MEITYSYSIPPGRCDRFLQPGNAKLGWTARPENETPDPSGIITLAFEKDKLISVVGIIPQAEGSMVMLGQQEKP